MKDDMISRSGLIAELESFKVVTGDPVIRVIVDRIIGVVKDQPEAKAPTPVRFSIEPNGLRFF